MAASTLKPDAHQHPDSQLSAVVFWVGFSVFLVTLALPVKVPETGSVVGPVTEPGAAQAPAGPAPQ